VSTPRLKLSRSLRKRLAEAANHRCSYCRSPAIVGIPMVIDHILPLVAGGDSTFNNLCLACYRCNERKGKRITSNDILTGESVPLFNPRTQNWSEHFAWHENSLEIVALSAIGRVTVQLLRLNDDWLRQARRLWTISGVHPPLE
jgi:hypothetical protein